MPFLERIWRRTARADCKPMREGKGFFTRPERPMSSKGRSSMSSLFRRQHRGGRDHLAPAQVYLRLAADQCDELPVQQASLSRRILAILGATAIAVFVPWAAADSAFAHSHGSHHGKVDFARKSDSEGDGQGDHQDHGDKGNGHKSGQGASNGGASANNGQGKSVGQNKSNASANGKSRGHGKSHGQAKSNASANKAQPSATANSPSANSGQGATGGNQNGTPSATANSPSANSQAGKTNGQTRPTAHSPGANAGQRATGVHKSR